MRILSAALVLALATVLSGCAPREPASPWQAVEVPTDADLTGLWFADSLNGWATGGGWAIEGGIVGRTRDGGRTWSFESGVFRGGKGGGLGRVQFLDSLRGCAVAAHGALLLTDDGGASWRPARDAGGLVSDLQFLDRSTGWAAGTLVERTDDGGETWRPLVRGAAENGYVSANAIHFVDESRGWLVGHGAALKHTDDGGITWQPVGLPLRGDERPTLRDLTFVDANHGWIVGEEGSIFHTGDGGASWERQETGVPVVRVIPRGEAPRPREVVPELETPPDRLALVRVAFADELHGWAVGSYSDVAESVILRTDDGGTTWRVEHVQPGEMLRSLFVLDVDHAWAAGDRARQRPQVILRYAPAAR